MESHKFLSLMVAFVAIAYGLGRLVGAASVPSEPDTVVAEDASASAAAVQNSPAGNVPPVSVEPPASNLAAPAKRPAARPTAKPPVQKPAVAAQPAAKAGGGARQVAAVPPAARPRSVIGELPVEPGMPEDNGEPMADAKPSPLPKAPKGWMTSPARGADDPLVVVIVSSDFQ